MQNPAALANTGCASKGARWRSPLIGHATTHLCERRRRQPKSRFTLAERCRQTNAAFSVKKR